MSSADAKYFNMLHPENQFAVRYTRWPSDLTFIFYLTNQGNGWWTATIRGPVRLSMAGDNPTCDYGTRDRSSHRRARIR
jgi:hypothetical protein